MVSVPGMAMNPFSSGSFGEGALSGREAAVEGSATESRAGRMVWAGGAASLRGGAVVDDETVARAAGTVEVGAGLAWPCSSASSRALSDCRCCCAWTISARSAATESCALAAQGNNASGNNVASVSGFIACSVEKKHLSRPGRIPAAISPIAHVATRWMPPSCLREACPFTMVEAGLWLREFRMKPYVINGTYLTRVAI